MNKPETVIVSRQAIYIIRAYFFCCILMAIQGCKERIEENSLGADSPSTNDLGKNQDLPSATGNNRLEHPIASAEIQDISWELESLRTTYDLLEKLEVLNSKEQLTKRESLERREWESIIVARLRQSAARVESRSMGRPEYK